MGKSTLRAARLRDSSAKYLQRLLHLRDPSVWGNKFVVGNESKPFFFGGLPTIVASGGTAEPQSQELNQSSLLEIVGIGVDTNASLEGRTTSQLGYLYTVNQETQHNVEFREEKFHLAIEDSGKL